MLTSVLVPEEPVQAQTFAQERPNPDPTADPTADPTPTQRRLNRSIPSVSLSALLRYEKAPKLRRPLPFP